MYRYYLASLTQVVVTCFAQQKYGIKRKKGFCPTKKNAIIQKRIEKKKTFLDMFLSEGIFDWI